MTLKRQILYFNQSKINVNYGNKPHEKEKSVYKYLKNFNIISEKKLLFSYKIQDNSTVLLLVY